MGKDSEFQLKQAAALLIALGTFSDKEITVFSPNVTVVAILKFCFKGSYYKVNRGYQWRIRLPSKHSPTIANTIHRYFGDEFNNLMKWMNQN